MCLERGRCEFVNFLSQRIGGNRVSLALGKIIRMPVLEPCEEIDGREIISAFLLFDHLKKLTFSAVLVFYCQTAYHFTAAPGACNQPATAAGIFSAMDTIKTLKGCRGADAFSHDIFAPGFPPAFLHFPTVAFHAFTSSEEIEVYTIPQCGI